MADTAEQDDVWTRLQASQLETAKKLSTEVVAGDNWETIVRKLARGAEIKAVPTTISCDDDAVLAFPGYYPALAPMTGAKEAILGWISRIQASLCWVLANQSPAFHHDRNWHIGEEYCGIDATSTNITATSNFHSLSVHINVPE